MQQVVNGRVFELQQCSDGSIYANDVRRAAGIPSGRQLILQLPDGSNRIVNPGEKIPLRSSHFTHVPDHKRG